MRDGGSRQRDRPWARLEDHCLRVDTMDDKAGVRELRQQASSVLKRVVDGEVIEVTDQLLDLMDELDLPRPPETGRELPSQALADLRSDER